LFGSTRGPSEKIGARSASGAEWRLVVLLTLLCLWATGTVLPAARAQVGIPAPGTLPSGNGLQVDHLSIEQGLSQNSIYCILQDGQGFLWFGTQDGLNRYDGYGFEVYRPRPGDANSLSHHFIRALAEGADGALWIGTDGGGLNRLDKETGQIARYQHDPTDAGSLSGDRVYALYSDPEGRLWIATEDGLDRLDPGAADFVHFEHDSQASGSLTSGAIRAIYRDRAGILWLGSDGGGLDRLDPATGQLTHYRHEDGDPASLSDDVVLAIVEDRAGSLWVGTGGGGLERLDRATGRFEHHRHDAGDANTLSNDAVSALYEDRDGILWVGTMGGGLDRFDRESGEFSHYQGGLTHDFVSAIFEDRSGILWVGTLGGGINYSGCAPRAFALYQSNPETPNGLSENVIWSIWEDLDGAVWIGTFGGGLDRLDRQSGQWTHYRHDPGDLATLSDDVVRAVRQDRQGVIWVGTDGGGLDRLDPATGRFAHYRHDDADPASLSHDAILTLYLDNQDELWVGTWGGLNRFDRATSSFARYLHDPGDSGSLSHNTVRAIYQDRSGALWIGTPQGLNRLDQATGTFIRYQADPQDPNSLSSDDILAIYQDRAGTLWVGTFGGGLNRFDPETGTFGHYGAQDGLPSAIVYGILEERSGPGSPAGPLWLSTNGGLSRLDLDTGTFVNYDVRDGLQSNEFNAGAYFQNADGEMFFGGVNGLNSFFPADVQPNPYVPPIVLTSLRQSGVDLASGAPLASRRSISLRWPDNDFEFEFAALSFCQPERNRYAYRLEGFDREWVDAGTRRVGRYTNLPGGTYTLHVKGSNSDGIWNEGGLALQVTVVPPFWATAWFRGLAGMVVAAAGLAVFRLRIRAVENRSRALESQVSQRTAELRHEMEQRVELEQALRQSEAERAVVEERNRLARDLHDSVTQSLYAVTLYADAAARLLSSGQAAAVGTNLQKLRRTAREALGEMRLLIFELRPPVLEQEGLAAALRTRLEAVEGRAGVQTALYAEGEGRPPSDVEEGLYRIAVEALNNALKHAQAHSISVTLELEPGEARLEVADDGAGFDPDAACRSGGMGLRGMFERAEQMGGRLAVDSEPGRGTHVRVAVRYPVEEESR
jgi:signal transduction histidine kinase/ligand-binding sensor domain-containing protein